MIEIASFRPVIRPRKCDGFYVCLLKYLKYYGKKSDFSVYKEAHMEKGSAKGLRGERDLEP